MVGAVGDRAHDSFEAIEEWLPLHLLGVLGLATGSVVGSPWIELRDEEGELVRRSYVRPNTPVYVAGHTAVRNATGLARLGCLLSAASLPGASAALNEPYLRVTIKLMIRAKLESASVEDGVAYATRAVDALCQEFELQKRPGAKEVLSESQVEELDALLSGAADGIRGMAETASGADERERAEMLEEIARKTLGVVYLNTGFNKEAVVGLLEKFDLADERIVWPFIPDGLLLPRGPPIRLGEHPHLEIRRVGVRARRPRYIKRFAARSEARFQFETLHLAISDNL